MIRIITTFCLLFLLAIAGQNALGAQYNKKKKKKSHNARSSRIYKTSRHGRKSHHSAHHGTGPDLKSSTTNSPYTEDPNNGVTPVETKAPGQ